jgi:phosphatidylglycerophosphate synthase
MAESYIPKYRRPVAGMFRRTAGPAVDFCVKRNISADSISYASSACALFAGLGFWQSGRLPALLIFAPAFCYGRLYCNMLDGMVAIASGKASRRGEILNELPDRVSDLLIFIGVAYSGLGDPTAGYWAAIFALLTAYVGTFGQALGVQREYSGMMSKPWRMVTLHIGAWLAFTLIALRGSSQIGTVRVLTLTCMLIVVGCVQTIVIRLIRIVRALNQQPRLPRDQ